MQHVEATSSASRAAQESLGTLAAKPPHHPQKFKIKHQLQCIKKLFIKLLIQLLIHGRID
jgi:hypothetical protein